MTKTSIRGGLGALAVVGLIFVGVAVTTSAGATSGPKLTRCEELPHLWSGAGEINYLPQAGTVTFVWDDGEATMRDTDRGCPSQPGLDAELRGNVEGWLASERAACADLRDLLGAVKSERRAQGKATRGRVPVSEEAAVAAARQSPSGGQVADFGAIAAKHQGVGQRTIDLDMSEAVLARCP